jgi:hypothetical protein
LVNTPNDVLAGKSSASDIASFKKSDAEPGEGEIGAIEATEIEELA